MLFVPQINPMPAIGIFAKTFTRPSLKEVLSAVKEHGFSHIQFNMACAGLPSMPDEILPSVLADIRMAVETSGLIVPGVSGTFNMCHPDDQVREKGIRRLAGLAQSCEHIGTSLITLCTGTRDPEDKWRHHPDNASLASWKEMCRTMEQAIGIAERYDLFLGIEPELANVVSSAHKARQLLDEMRTDRLRIVLDPANLFEHASVSEIKTLIDEAIDLLGPSIIMAHAKGKDHLGQFVPPGQGMIPFAYFIQRLQDNDLHPPLIAHGFEEEKVKQVSSYLRGLM